MVSVMLYPCIFCVTLSMDLFCFMCCVFDSVCELFGKTIRNMFGCVCYFVVEYEGALSVVGGALLDDHVWSSKECVCCACRPSERLDAPSIRLFVFCYLLI